MSYEDDENRTPRTAPGMPGAWAAPAGRRRRIAVIGAGAAGTLTATRLLDRAGRRGVALEVALLDPAAESGRGVAYSTEEPRHLLNVPAAAISADPDDPEDFLRWLSARGDWADPYSFQPRSRYGCYLADLLGYSAAAAGPEVGLCRLRERVTGISRAGNSILILRLAGGRALIADAVVLALGQFAPDTSWAPEMLRENPYFVADPWAPGALQGIPEHGDVLLVGTGLTMVDTALVMDRPGRVIHAISRSGLLPQPHSPRPLDRIPPPSFEGCDSLGDVRRAVLRHISAYRRQHGDWRPALDALRPVTAQLWQRLAPTEQSRFLAEDARLWDTHRHRIAPATGAILRNIKAAGRLDVAAAQLHDAKQAADGDGLLVRLSDDRELRVAAVVNCTGPRNDFAGSGDPLIAELLHLGWARPGPLGLGLDTAADGRLVNARGDRPSAADPALWTLGAARRGTLWESTAIPELRVQALDLAAAILDHDPGRSGSDASAAPAALPPLSLGSDFLYG